MGDSFEVCLGLVFCGAIMLSVIVLLYSWIKSAMDTCKEKRKEKQLQEEMKNKGITIENLLERVGFTAEEAKMPFSDDGGRYGWRIFDVLDRELKSDAKLFLLSDTSVSIDEFMERQALMAVVKIVGTYCNHKRTNRINFYLPPRLFLALEHFDHSSSGLDLRQVAVKFIAHLRDQKET